MRHDRLTTYEGIQLPFAEAIANEFEHGIASLRAGGAAGAARFAGGEGRHGAL
jgi:enoyl-CoA hydratase